MKSERRHKLQENSLAHSLENLPKMGRESGSKLLLGIVTVLLVIVLIRYYLMSREQKKEMIATELTNARYDLADLSGEHDIERQLEMSGGQRMSVTLTARSASRGWRISGRKWMPSLPRHRTCRWLRRLRTFWPTLTFIWPCWAIRRKRRLGRIWHCPGRPTICSTTRRGRTRRYWK